MRQSGADHPSAPPGAQNTKGVHSVHAVLSDSVVSGGRSVSLWTVVAGSGLQEPACYLAPPVLLYCQDCRLMPFGRVAPAVAPLRSETARRRAKSRRSAVELMPGRYSARPSRLSPAEPPGRPGRTGRSLRSRPVPCQRENRALPSRPALRRESPTAAAFRQHHTPRQQC